MKRAFCTAALIALACLLVRAGRVGLGGDYVDPLSGVTAQDENQYVHSAIRMAREGGWLTPMFMGSSVANQPPMLLWASALAVHLLGVTRIALRIPVAIFASLAAGLVFLWAVELRSWLAGVCAVALLVSNHLFHVLGGLCMTDGLLVSFFTAALYFLFSDPWLESPLALPGFAGAVAAAILTKGFAGLLPLGVLALYWVAAPHKFRPRFSRVCLAVTLSLALAAPWFLYQATHGHWLPGEPFGGGDSSRAEGRIVFYWLRMAAVDPALLSVLVLALPAFVKELRKRSNEAVLLLCWTAVPLAALLVWQNHDIAYLLPMVPALAIVAAAYSPFSYTSRRSAAAMFLLVGAAIALKTALPWAPWGLSFRAGTVQAAAPALSSYCGLARGNELIVVSDEGLYASVLPLEKLHYSLAAGETGALQRVARMISARPASDFLLPDEYLPVVEAAAEATHVLVDAPPGNFFLLSRERRPRRAPPAWSCSL